MKFKTIHLFIFFSILNFNCFSQNQKYFKIDTTYIYNNNLPIWIVTTAGWGDKAIERINAYNNVAKKWKLNIKFSSRLGTFTSYKYAPSVVKNIQKHNRITFKAYQKEFGENWQQRFAIEVKNELKIKGEHRTKNTQKKKLKKKQERK